MRVSLNWIKSLLNVSDLGLPTNALIDRLTLRVAEFAGDVTHTGPKLDGVVVGKVLTCTQHPNADRLRVTTVDVGGGIVEPIVCGAPNVAAGQTVCVATIGTSLTMPGKDGKPTTITIKEAKLRGELSRGMICAADELGLPGGHDGIIVLDDKHTAGTPVATALGVSSDEVLFIENSCLTHRPDLWGHWGWAREIALVCGLNPPADLDIAPGTADFQSASPAWSVAIETDGCTRYCGAVVEGVANRPSPQWLQDRLAAVGLRPLGFLVDLTNYVMLDLGEPMHAFDRRDLAGSRITVRNAGAGEAFTTLDGKAHTLTPDDLLIADSARAVALAGIMGGQNSMVRDDTTSVVLEAATFRPDRIRRTRIRTGVATDSSTRFEKTLYPELAAAALNRAIALIRAEFPEARVTARFAAGAPQAAARTIAFDATLTPRLTGQAIPLDEQRGILTGLGFTVSGDTATIPWWRTKDVSCPADLVEEIARHHGYDRIAPETPRLPAAAPTPNALRQAEHRARRALSALGWDEVATYALTSNEWIETLGVTDKAIHLAHPLASNQAVLRPSLQPNLLDAIALNRKHRDDVAIFEIGKRYGHGLGLNGAAGETGANLVGTPDEELLVAGACAKQGDDQPFFAARDTALALLRGLGYTPRFAVRSEPHPELATGRAVDVFIDALHVGVAGEASKAARTRANCQTATGAPERVGWFSLRLEHLTAKLGSPKPITHRAPSRFPAVEREFTWVCPVTLPYGDLVSATRRAAGDLCTGIDLLTIYKGSPIPDGQHAVSLRVTLQSRDKTLEDADLVPVTNRIIQQVAQRTGATLRA
jgi:phenylalanyl-tRNA synthetase beta chain